MNSGGTLSGILHLGGGGQVSSDLYGTGGGEEAVEPGVCTKRRQVKKLTLLSQLTLLSSRGGGCPSRHGSCGYKERS
ncbi:MAG: hypothetical protein SGPRY_008944 [Prymnesium sp.]